MKKLFSLVLALVMALSLTTVAWGADPVAKIGDTPYDTVAAALANVQNGETITIQNVTGDESGTEIDFDSTGDISFTITGTAPDYKMPIITFADKNADGGKIVVNIVGADLAIPELDARQNATINVVNSKLVGAGGNSIAKSYYNGAINVSGTSQVWFHQITTMGYITVESGAKVTATWQTNVLGNGLITIKSGATYNTSAMQLTGAPYSGRDNTDADRVGKPAEVIVDGGTMVVGEAIAANGADYSYETDSYGINIGTVSGEEAVLTIKNNADVTMKQTGNPSAAFGGKISIGENGTVNVDNSSLSVEERGNSAGDVELQVAGNLNVSANSTVDSSTTSIAVKDGGTLKSAGDISGEISKETNGTIEVTGGSYTDDVSDYVAGGYVQGGNGSVVTPVAQVGSAKYATLAEAVAAAPAGGTVKLLADCGESVTVAKNLTFDFNGTNFTGFITPAAGYTYMDGVVKKAVSSGTTSTGTVTSGTVTATKAKMYRLATAGTSMTELFDVTKIEKTTVTGKLVNDVPAYVPNIYKINDATYYVEVAKADATFALKNNGAYVYLAPATGCADANAVITKFATAVVLDQYIAAAEDVECGDAVKGTKGAAIYMSGNDAYYADGSDWAYFKGEFVKYNAKAKVDFQPHKWDAKSIIVKATDVKGTKVPVSIECEKCEKTFSIVPSAKFDNTWVKGVNYTTDTAVDKYNTAAVKYYIVLENATYTGTYVPSIPSTDKVQSADTFDAGIAMYVGMSVMAAAGSAVVIGKKRED